MSISLICPRPDRPAAQERLDGVLSHALAGREVTVLRRAEELSHLEGKKLLFALPLGEVGINLEYVRMLERLRREPRLLEGCLGGLIVDGQGSCTPSRPPLSWFWRLIWQAAPSWAAPWWRAPTPWPILLSRPKIWAPI